MKKIIFLALLGCCCALPSFAQSTKYISDELETPARAGSSDRFKITRSLKSGLKVSVLEENKATGYSLVSSDNSYQGWVLTRHLTNEPSARNYLAEAKERYEPSRLKIVELEENLKKANDIEAQLRTAIDNFAQKSQTQDEELAGIKRVSSNALEILDQNKQLTVTTADLKQRLQQANIDNQRLRDDVKSREQITGASIFILGIFLGLVVIPRLASRKRKQHTGY